MHYARLIGALGLATAIVVASAIAAFADPLVSETFTHPTVASSNWVAGGTGFNACLTASANVSQVPVPGCGGSPDADGSGALRLTDATISEAGFLLYNSPRPFTAGLDVGFDFFMYNGSFDPADGISFFVVDGTTSLTQPGPAGGALGYSSDSVNPGVSHGFIGVGLDEWGNYATDGASGVGCTPVGHLRTPNEVTIRGPGNGVNGYCILASNYTLPGSLHGTAPRNTARRHAHIVMDPSNAASPKVTVFVDFGAGAVQVLQTPLPANPPATFKFGFAGSTGALTAVHEIANMTSNTIQGLPALSVQKTHTGTFTPGGSASYAITVSTDPAHGPELQPVTVTDSLPAGLTLAGTPAGTGWDCTQSSAVTSTVSCTFAASPSSPIPPGTALPVITVPVAIANSAAGTITNVATANSGDALAPASSSDAANVVVPALPQAGHPTSEPPVWLIPATGLVGGAALLGVLVAVRSSRRRRPTIG